MIKSIWTWVVAAFGFLVAALLLVIGRWKSARHKVERVNDDLQTERIIRGAEKRVAKERDSVRKQAREVQREHEARPSDKRPRGVFRRK